MKILYISLLIAVCCSGEEAEVQGTREERFPILTLKMRVIEIVPLPENGLRIITQAESEADNWGLVINIPGGKFKKSMDSLNGSRFRYPVFLEPTTNGRDTLDRLLTTTVGKGSPQTLFKPRGYSGATDITPKKLGEKGGWLFLTDPGIDGGLALDITVELDVKKRSLSFRAGVETY